MNTVIPVWDIPSLSVAGTNDRFPVRRVFCVGRNYADHQKEMGGSGRDLPFFFAKAAHDVVADGGDVPYPPGTANYHWETELVVAIGRQGAQIAATDAPGHVWGYAVGLDMTRRDLQQVGKDKGQPWTFGKDFDRAAPMGALVPAARIGHPASARIWLRVNGEVRQDANIDQMVWSVPEQIAFLSRHYTLMPGDLIMTGTPAGVGAAKPGDELVAAIDGLGELRVRITPPA